jgi:hypothetical protein
MAIQRCRFTPTKLSQTVMFLAFIQEVPNLILGWDTDYSDCGFSWFYSIHSGKCWYTADSFHSVRKFIIHYHMQILTLYRPTSSLRLAMGYLY